jgi:hypothetical protein
VAFNQPLKVLDTGRPMRPDLQDDRVLRVRHPTPGQRSAARARSVEWEDRDLIPCRLTARGSCV